MKILREIKLSETRLTYMESEKVINGLFNLYKIKAYRLEATMSDTNFTYWIYTREKVNKPILEGIKYFIEGVKYGCK